MQFECDSDVCEDVRVPPDSIYVNRRDLEKERRNVNRRLLKGMKLTVRREWEKLGRMGRIGENKNGSAVIFNAIVRVRI